MRFLCNILLYLYVSIHIYIYIYTSSRYSSTLWINTGKARLMFMGLKNMVHVAKWNGHWSSLRICSVRDTLQTLLHVAHSVQQLSVSPIQSFIQIKHKALTIISLTIVSLTIIALTIISLTIIALTIISHSQTWEYVEYAI